MKIRVTLNFTHPHFGGHEITTWDYEMEEGTKAEQQYRKLVKYHCASGYATAEISIVHDGFKSAALANEAAT